MSGGHGRSSGVRPGLAWVLLVITAALIGGLAAAALVHVSLVVAVAVSVVAGGIAAFAAMRWPGPADRAGLTGQPGPAVRPDTPRGLAGPASLGPAHRPEKSPVPPHRPSHARPRPSGPKDGETVVQLMPTTPRKERQEWWDAAQDSAPPAPSPAAQRAPAPDLSSYLASTIIAQCPNCGAFRLDFRRSGNGWDFRCESCGYTWAWQPGTPWPPVRVAPARRTQQGRTQQGRTELRRSNERHTRMYERDISRRDPGCVVFLLDRSDSMKQKWGNTRESMAEGAARALNETLLELLFTSQGEPGKPRHYFDVGVFGYGMRPTSGGEGVEPAFGGKLAGQPLVALPDLRDNPIAVRQAPSMDVGAPPSRVPVWVEPVHGYRTPMCQAIAVAGAHVYEWASAHPDSFPPIIINITDGMVTDSPYEGATLEQWAQRLVSIQTSDGPALLFNIFLSPSGTANGVMFPATEHGLPTPGPDLFRISSPLPPPMVANAQRAGIAVDPGARGFGFNADASMLVRFLEVGTKVDVRD